MPSLFTRVEAAILNPLRRPALSGVAEHGAFWSSAAFLVLLLLRLVPGLVGMFGAFWLVFVVPVWVVFSCIILYRWLVNQVLWKVRNRLVVTYLLMGLTPVVLFVTLAGIASYVFSGQFATFAATSELETTLGRLSAENQAFTVHVAHSIARAPSANSVELSDYDTASHGIMGRLTVDAWVASPAGNRHLLLVNDGRELPQHNANDPITYPDWSPDGFRGIVIDNGRLFLRAVNERTVAGNKVTFVSSAPLDPATVDQLAQGLGLIQIAPGFGKVIAEDDGKATRSRSRRVTPRELATQTTGTVNGGKLPSPAFLLDRRITFSALLTTTEWANGKKLTGLLSVTSRPALLYAQLFGTAVEVRNIIRYALIALTVSSHHRHRQRRLRASHPGAAPRPARRSFHLVQHHVGIAGAPAGAAARERADAERARDCAGGAEQSFPAG
jgi:phosphoserine phosphatase RsbU/P